MSLRQCLDCGAVVQLGELSHDGKCPQCGGITVPIPNDDDPADEWEDQGMDWPGRRLRIGDSGPGSFIAHIQAQIDAADRRDAADAAKRRQAPKAEPPTEPEHEE